MASERDGSTRERRGRWAAIRRFAQLSAPRRRLWLEAWLALLRADLALRLAPRRTLARALAPGAGDPLATPTEPAVWAVASAAARHLRPMTCLPRAVALRELLARRGVGCRLRIGVRKDAGRLAAHAWVEVAGVPLGEPEAIEARFAPLLESAAPPAEAG